MANNRTGPDFTKDDWDWEDLLKWGRKEEDDDWKKRQRLVAKGKHINKFKS
jgi:hypothetical protein